MKRIDIGCGHKPTKDYDVYVDVYMSKEVQANEVVKSKFIMTPAEDLSMFKDKEFDYAKCHHVIEHVNDPAKACAEMVRVAKRGTLWFPSTPIELLCGRKDHNWMVFQITDRGHNIPNRLLFIKKRFNSYYGHSRSTLPEGVKQHIALEQTPFNWEGSFEWTVVL